MRTLVGGDPDVTSYREGDDRYDVMLRVDKAFRNSPNALQRLYYRPHTLGNVPLSNVASPRARHWPTKIERYNRVRQIMITGKHRQGGSLSEALALLESTVQEMDLPVEYSAALVGRSKELGRAAKNYGIALLLSLIFMYMILAAHLKASSIHQILLSLPLSVPFALISLYAFARTSRSSTRPRNSSSCSASLRRTRILQIDHIKSLRRGGLPRLEAI